MVNRSLVYTYSYFFLLHFSMIESSPTNTFPENFLLGYATASYQIEGGWNEDGKGENIWDRLTHTRPEMIRGCANGDVAADSYHKYKEDVAMLKNLGAQVYRFSLSWSRILPTGHIDVINKPGVDYYNNLINELLRNGIEPMVTLYHWDLPQPLQDLGGWANPVLVDYFEDYARIAFKYFGDRVKKWITFNEPIQVCLYGYGLNEQAPALNLHGIGEYLCGHTLLISHARAYHLYDKEFRSQQKGVVGIALDGGWNEPLSSSEDDILAAETHMQFEVGWFGHPIFKGDYPKVMRDRIYENSLSEGRKRSRLPTFDTAMINFVKGTADFLGLNHYTSNLVSKAKKLQGAKPSWKRDTGNNVTQDPSWESTIAPWLKVTPWGFRKQLNWIKTQYGNITVFITENGFPDEGILKDERRISYFTEYIREMLQAIHIDKCNVVGYIAWSLMDNFEWLDGYDFKFGIYNVDFNSPNRTRTEKSSVEFFKKLYSTRKLPTEITHEKESNAIPPTKY